MKQYIMSVYDSKSEMFNQPIFSIAKGEALRAFSDSVNTKNSPMNNHPEDYTLFEIGTFDPEVGQIEAIATPRSMGLATEYIQRDPQMELKESKFGFNQDQAKTL